MRKFKVLVLAVALVFASVTLAQAQLGGVSYGTNGSAVNYSHADNTFAGIGGLDLTGAAAGYVGTKLLGAGALGLGGAVVLGGIGALAGGVIGDIAGAFINWPIALPAALVGAAVGGLAGMSLNSYVYQFGTRIGLRAGEGLLGGIIGGTLDTFLLGSITNMFPGGTILGALLGAEQMGPIDSILGQGIIANTLAKAAGGVVGLIAGGILGGIAGAALAGAPVALLGAGALGGICALAGGVIGGGIGLLTPGIPAAIAGFGLGNTMDEVIQAGLTRGDSAPAKPAASVADFM
jgi:hypothetical protein